MSNPEVTSAKGLLSKLMGVVKGMRDEGRNKRRLQELRELNPDRESMRINEFDSNEFVRRLTSLSEVVRANYLIQQLEDNGCQIATLSPGRFFDSSTGHKVFTFSSDPYHARASRVQSAVNTNFGMVEALMSDGQLEGAMELIASELARGGTQFVPELSRDDNRLIGAELLQLRGQVYEWMSEKLINDAAKDYHLLKAADHYAHALGIKISTDPRLFSSLAVGIDHLTGIVCDLGGQDLAEGIIGGYYVAQGQPRELIWHGNSNTLHSFLR